MTGRSCPDATGTRGSRHDDLRPGGATVHAGEAGRTQCRWVSGSRTALGFAVEVRGDDGRVADPMPLEGKRAGVVSAS
jgi:hypothetical protein